MNKSAKILIALLAISVTGLFAQAQSPRILFVDMVKVMNEHYKTEEQKTKLQVDAEKASAEAEKILKEQIEKKEDTIVLEKESAKETDGVDAMAAATAAAAIAIVMENVGCVDMSFLVIHFRALRASTVTFS